MADNNVFIRMTIFCCGLDHSFLIFFAICIIIMKIHWISFKIVTRSSRNCRRTCKIIPVQIYISSSSNLVQSCRRRDNDRLTENLERYQDIFIELWSLRSDLEIQGLQDFHGIFKNLKTFASLYITNFLCNFKGILFSYLISIL